MPKPKQINWKDIQPGKKPLCIVGAGFPIGMLTTRIPSTETIIQDTVKTTPQDFPALAALVNNIKPSNLRLNFIWANIRCMAKLLVPFYNQINRQYSRSISTGIINFLSYYKSIKFKSQTDKKETILWVLLGIELKKMISKNYSFSSISPWKITSIKKVSSLLRKKATFTWLSLNYDLVLEKLLLNHEKVTSFNKNTKEICYSFSTLLIDPYRFPQPTKHLIVKPHGSVNVSFNSQYIKKKITKHSAQFIDPNNFWNTLPQSAYGYSRKRMPFKERRAWLIGYLPDDAKDELNSPALFSDMSHDLCKWNMATSSYSFYYATSLIIIGYSMPSADEWIWKRVENMPNQKLNVYIASGSDSNTIAASFANKGFRNIFIINGGYI
jgi:hypothetical protein